MSPKVITWNGSWSFCLGNTIVMQKDYKQIDYRHEYGHHLQFCRYGWFKYYLCIAIPSVIGWWIDILFHRKWTNYDRYCWYYAQPWEAEADLLGGVKR